MRSFVGVGQPQLIGFDGIHFFQVSEAKMAIVAFQRGLVFLYVLDELFEIVAIVSTVEEGTKVTSTFRDTGIVVDESIGAIYVAKIVCDKELYLRALLSAEKYLFQISETKFVSKQLSV